MSNRIVIPVNGLYVEYWDQVTHSQAVAKAIAISVGDPDAPPQWHTATTTKVLITQDRGETIWVAVNKFIWDDSNQIQFDGV